VLLFFLLTGTYPVRGETLDEVRQAHASRPTDGAAIATLRRLRPSVPRRLTSILDRAIDPLPGRRFGGAEQMAAMLHAWLSAPRRRRVAFAIAVGIAIVAISVSTIDRVFGPNRNAMLPAPSFRQIDVGYAAFLDGATSPDGRLLSYADARTGNLATVDLRNGSTTQLTDDADWGRMRYTTTSRFSPDGQYVAYSWYQGGDGAELRVVALADRHRRTILRDPIADDFGVLDWSHNGGSLAVRIEGRDGSTRLQLVSLQDGSARTLASPGPRGAAFSPDDRLIVFDRAPSLTAPRNLWIVDVAGADSPLVSSPFDDREPIWSGAQVVFTSNRGGRRGLWRVEVRNGKAAGEPTLVSDQLAAGFWPIGLTRSGSLFYAAAEGIAGVYAASLQANTEVATPARLSAADQPALSPDWSPDGQSIVWIGRSRVEGNRGATIRLRRLDTGETRVLTMPFLVGLNPRWSPDGHRLLVRIEDRGAAIALIDLASGRPLRRLLDAHPQLGDVEWAPDGLSAFFMDFKARSIGRLDVESGRERTIYQLPPGQELGRGIAVSPDGRTIAFNAFAGTHSSILTIPSAGGRPTARLTLDPPHRLMLEQWMRDGRHLMFVRSREIPDGVIGNEWQLWTLDVISGTMRYLDFSMPGLHEVRASPDGRHLAFSSSNAANRLRVLDNVVPAGQGAFR